MQNLAKYVLKLLWLFNSDSASLMINGVPQMWFVRFFPKKYYFFPFFLTLCSVATIKNLSAAEISEKYNLTQIIKRKRHTL